MVRKENDNRDVSQIIKDNLEDICEKYGYNSLYIEEYSMAAAVKASAYFQALGFDYGDRIPSVYKLNDTILELITCVIQKDIEWSSTGMFRVLKVWDDWGDGKGQWEFVVTLELVDFLEHRIREDNQQN